MTKLPKELCEARSAAARLWANAVKALPISDLAYHATVPGYFIDRYALLMCAGRADLAIKAISSQVAGWARSEWDYADRIRRNWVATESLGGWVPNGDDPPTDTLFGLWLRERWAVYAAELNLPHELANVVTVSGESWLSLTRRSVFYPSLPAIPGANYFDFLDDSDRRTAVSEFGATAAIDFFVFMLQVHENAHIWQIGEPLMNEILQAAMWVGFLDKEDLWCLQRNTVSGRSCCLELALIREHPNLLELAARTSDCADSFSEDYSYDGYLLASGWAHCFDTGRVRYREYLTGVSIILSGLGDGGTMATLNPMTGFLEPEKLRRLLAA